MGAMSSGGVPYALLASDLRAPIEHTQILPLHCVCMASQQANTYASPVQAALPSAAPAQASWASCFALHSIHQAHRGSFIQRALLLGMSMKCTSLVHTNVKSTNNSALSQTDPNKLIMSLESCSHPNPQNYQKHRSLDSMFHYTRPVYPEPISLRQDAAAHRCTHS